MKLFNLKSNDSRSRRSTRIWMLQMRTAALYASIAALVATAGFEGYRSLQKCREWIAAETLTRTAAAGFKVNDILVMGRHEIPAAQLLSNLGIHQGQPMFNVDIAEAQKSIAAISWVKDVSVSRRLPDTIIVAITERQPAALWQYQKKISLIDRDGNILTDDNLGAWQNLPLVVGAGAEKSTGELIGLLQAEPAVAANLISAVRVEGRRWDLHMKNNIVVKLPETDMELALRRLTVMDEKKNVFGRAIAAIDLRQPERVIVTPRGTAETPTKTKT